MSQFGNYTHVFVKNKHFVRGFRSIQFDKTNATIATIEQFNVWNKRKRVLEKFIRTIPINSLKFKQCRSILFDLNFLLKHVTIDPCK